MDHTKKIRDTELINDLAAALRSTSLSGPITLMEVCGTHTMAIHRAGLPAVFPKNMTLISGPGCPVCVTPEDYLETVFAIAKKYQVTITTFGDMVRVPGVSGTLAGLRASGKKIETVYSPLNALEKAQNEPESEVIFLAVGFETTAPVVAATVMQAKQKNINNFSILSAHKLVIPALKALISDPELKIDGFLLPGHVSAVLGCKPYEFIAEDYKRACVVTGFESADIIQGLLMLASQIERSEFSIEIQYDRVVRPEGNTKAWNIIETVFEPSDTRWRGFGIILESGLTLRKEFSEFDALLKFPVEIEIPPEPAGCKCGHVLQGRIKPQECALFGKACTPESPIGPCMVSTEGTCAAFYKYSRRNLSR